MSEIEKISAMVDKSRDMMTVRRVYGEPIERDGTVVIPAASVSGGGGGGGGVDAHGQTGAGTGFGIHARPVGAFVIRDGVVRWEPVTDPMGRVIVVGATVVVGMLVGRSLVKSALRRRRRHERHHRHDERLPRLHLLARAWQLRPHRHHA